MDRAEAHDWMVGRPCFICDSDIEAGDDTAYDADPDAPRTAHGWCWDAIEARAHQLAAQWAPVRLRVTVRKALPETKGRRKAAQAPDRLLATASIAIAGGALTDVTIDQIKIWQGATPGEGVQVTAEGLRGLTEAHPLARAILKALDSAVDVFEMDASLPALYAVKAVAA